MGVFKLAAGVCLGLCGFVLVLLLVQELQQRRALAQSHERLHPTPTVRLSSGQQCVSGTVVERSRQQDGTPVAFQPLEFGRPIRCEGDWRVPD